MTLMYQNTTGELKAILAGSPVGRVIPAIAGMPEALQATALSKATLSRHPKSGVRNLANGAQAVSRSTYWPTTTSNNGITVAKVGSGVDTDGLPYLDISYVGVATAAAITGAYAISQSRVPSDIGVEYHSMLSAKIIAGSNAGTDGYKVSIVAETDSVYIGEINDTKQLNSSEYVHLFASGVLDRAGMNTARCSLGLVAKVGEPVDMTVRLKGLYFGRGTFSGFQFNYDLNDITEPDVADLWHLYNDGGDSLNVALPNGTYTAAWVDTKGQVFFNDAVVVAGGVAQNILMAERICDVLFVRRAMTAAEKRELTAYWEARYKA